ncbi:MULTISPECIES: DUF397 domain-containing protein [Streptomyces]|uniref:DUF397 domain-containing protein n=1 Tax=Streptomyces changanensis TaxID=2964669 RepID=A0ABY5N986_9ACTN|nr:MULTISPECIES: DUF397 domain-containing protein [Streptomyces]UUS32593.1 DUF397 domain-containing protein [Streptomyces changanensis]
MTHVSRADLSGAAWRKSSYSNQGGGDCVEVADGFTGVVPVRDSKNPHRPALVVTDGAWGAFVEWRKSSHSNAQGGECVEVGRGLAGLVPVRDSKDPARPGLVVSDRAWGAFLGSLT